MRKPPVVICAGLLGLLWLTTGLFTEEAATSSSSYDLVISNEGGELATVPLSGMTFAVSYRNSLYGTITEERYAVLPDGSYRLQTIAADEPAVLEEYYAVPAPAVTTEGADRRKWSINPDPAQPALFTRLSIAATDLGQRTVHVEGQASLELFNLVDDTNPFVEMYLEETP